jgi:epoxyqueuosine reductase
MVAGSKNQVARQTLPKEGFGEASLLTANIKHKAIQLGFDACGIARAGYLESEQNHFDAWLQQGMHADMAYMQNNAALRLNPSLLVDGAKSVICLLMNYKPAEQQNGQAPKIARYAYGRDYHDIIWEKLNLLLDYIRQCTPEVKGRGFSDSAPVFEKAWTVRAGLGWIGKNSILISPVFGSFIFLAELIVDIELDYDQPYASNGCGECNRCMANCPTGAIYAPKTVDARKCISYQTIENKGVITVDTNGWLFGCDICLQVCPWNKRTPASKHTELAPLPQILSMTADDWQNITEDEFKAIFRQSPLKRAKYAGIKRNLKHVLDHLSNKDL